MTLNQAKTVNANASTFEYFEVDFAVNSEAFELAA